MIVNTRVKLAISAPLSSPLGSGRRSLWLEYGGSFAGKNTIGIRGWFLHIRRKGSLIRDRARRWNLAIAAVPTHCPIGQLTERVLPAA